MENLSAQGQAQWPRSSSSAADGRAGGGAADVFNGGDDLVIDEGTISLSGAYSDGSAPSTVFAVRSLFLPPRATSTSLHGLKTRPGEREWRRLENGGQVE